MRIAMLLGALGLAAAASAASPDDWPQFRGPAGDGHAGAADPPLRWSETENVRWKTAIHDTGWSSPVICGRQVWLTTATPDGKQLYAVCLDRDTGRIIHDVKVLDVAKPEKIAGVNSYASPTPVVEPGRVYVHFGTYGTACLDAERGQVLWTRTDLTCDHHMGPGSSPIPFENLLIFNVDGCDVQYVVALQKATGQTVWRTDRNVDHGKAGRFWRKAFSTPTVFEHGGRLQMISPCAHALVSYDPRTGGELWRVRHRGWSISPRPVVGHGLVFCIMDCDHPELWALRPDGTGDVTDTHVAWRIERGRGMPSIPSVLLVGDLLFAVNDQGTAFSIEAKTGQIVWKQDIGKRHYASPLHAKGRIYFFGDDGAGTVIEADRTYKPLAVNSLAGPLRATPALSGNALFVRTGTHLYRIQQGP
jgi:outer membrane protein assembly factor BamB